MIEKPVLSPSFSVEDIRKLRTYEAEVQKNMTREEIFAYIKEGADRGRAEIARIRAENARKTEEQLILTK
jgi:predicted alpha/beta superfamily hydrolase